MRATPSVRVRFNESLGRAEGAYLPNNVLMSQEVWQKTYQNEERDEPYDGAPLASYDRVRVRKQLFLNFKDAFLRGENIGEQTV